jgi:hypothetical protein
MAENISTEQAVTQSTESAPVENQSATVNTPATENVVAEQNSGPGPVPYSRFKEKVDQVNQFESRLEELQNRLSAQEAHSAQAKRGNVAEKYEKMLVDKGLDPAVAKVMAEAQFGMVNDVLGERLGPLEQETAATRVDGWVNKLAQTHKDWFDLEPAMEKILDSLPKQLRPAFISSPEGLEMLYAKAKLGSVATQTQKAFTDGQNTAYQNKGLKNAMSPTPGASVPKPQAFDREAIMKMSEAELRANYDAILASRQKA